MSKRELQRIAPEILRASRDMQSAMAGRRPTTTHAVAHIERRQPPRHLILPTRERLDRMVNGYVAGTESKAHRQRPTIEAYDEYLPTDLAAAWGWYIEQKAIAAQAEAPSIGSYDRIGGSGFAPIDSKTSPEQSSAIATVAKIEASMAPEFRAVANFICDVFIDHNTGRLFSPQQFAQQRIRMADKLIRDATSLRWWTISAVYHTGARLKEFHWMDRALTRSKPTPLATVKRSDRP